MSWTTARKEERMNAVNGEITDFYALIGLI